MSILDEVLEHYEQPERVVLSETEQVQIEKDADEHLYEYLLGDGDSRHLHEYYNCLEKLS